MSTSLAEQLKRLQTPQSSQFIDLKKRDSILFTTKDAATKSRETIFEIGISGLQELIELNPVFEDFEKTLFEITAKDVQRAVESKEVNELLNKSIKRFMFHLSPYFMIPASHKCLEWLIRRFSINLYNKEEFLMLILPYHQTNMFVRCIQSMKFVDSSDKWHFLAEVQKSSAPLSKYALWNHGATQPSFLTFVGKFTYDAIKELENKAGSLHTMIAFYCTTLIGSMDQAATLNDNHILSVAKYLVKAYKSNLADFAAAGYMITAQLLVKARLGIPLLNELMEKITNNFQLPLSQNVILLLSLMFQSQTDELKITERTLENIMTFKWLPSALDQMKAEGKPSIAFYRALMCKLLEKNGDKSDHVMMYREYTEALTGEIVLDDEEAQVIIRSILDSYTQAPDEPSEEVKEEPMKMDEGAEEVISLDDSDDEEENIPLKSQDVTLWYSSFLKTLERRYPNAFDEVVKDVMKSIPGRKRNGLKNVLGFLLKVSCANSDSNVFENLYHHNSNIRREAVAYLVQNFNQINLKANDNGDILKMTITERLNDENPSVFLEVLNIKTSKLLELIGADELVAKLSKALMRFWKNPGKWSLVYQRALKVLTSDGVYQCVDPNIVLISVLPFLFVNEGPLSAETYQLIKESKYGKDSQFIKSLPKKLESSADMSAIVTEAFEKCLKLPSSESLLSTIKKILLENRQTGSFSIQFAFFVLANSIEPNRPAYFSLNVVQVAKEILAKRKLKLVKGEVSDVNHFKNQELPTDAIAILFKKVIRNTSFTGPSINFGHLDSEMKLKLEIFQFLVKNFFNAPMAERAVFNEVIKTFLDCVCHADHLVKLQFFSQFCASHAVYQDNDGTSLELQVRTMRLLNHVLISNQSQVKDYSNEFFQDVLIALSADQAVIRECGMQLIETLCQQKIPSSWKFFLEKLEARKSEILMDSEQISLLIYLMSNKKSSVHMKTIVEGMTSHIHKASTNDYMQASLLMILKHSNDSKVLGVMAGVASKMIADSDDTIVRFDDYQSSIVKLVLMKINQTSISSLWKLAMTSLECHRLLFDDDGKYLTPSMLVLKAIDEEIFTKLHPDHRNEILTKIIKCSMNEHPRIVTAAQKIFQCLDLDCKFITSVILKMPRLELEPMEKKKKINPGHVNPLMSEEWKSGVTLLELLQNKSKGMSNQHEMIPLLFDVLDNCLRSPPESNVEYTRQIVLSLLLNICQKVSPEGKSHRALGVQDSMLKTELVIRCIKESENPQTHHHSLLLLAQLALMTPDQVLNDMMAIFTFVGTTLVRHEDSYSFQIITKIIENVVPTLAHAKRGDDEVIPILKIFASIVLQVPEHRRLLLFVKLLQTLNVDKFLWMFIGLVLESQVMNHQKGAVQEELPQRVQVALAISKEFEVKTILESTTALIGYIKKLPMFIENKPGSIGGEDKIIFSVKTHTDHQLRHFKYLMLQFLKNLLSSPEVRAKVSKLDGNSKMEMKGLFQDIILNVLTLIPEISKALDHQKLKPFERSWQAILQNSFDILEAAIELLAPDMLLVVVENLMLHEFLLVRKKVIELLNRKLEEHYFDQCEDLKLLKLMIPLRKICDTIGNGDGNTALEVVQQSALMSVKLLARKLSEDNPEDFIELLDLLTSIIDNEKIKTAVLVNLVICVAELTADLKVRAIGLLGRFMPSLLQLMTVREDDPAAFLLLYAVVSAVLRVIETVPLFLSPYLPQIILQLTRLSPGLQMLQDSKIALSNAKIAKIWTAMSQLVPTRVLVPAIEDVYQKTVNKQHFASIEPLMDLMCEIFQNADGKDVKNHQAELTEFFLKAMQFRCEVEGKDVIGFEEINEIEFHIIRALVSLVMKLSEGSFRPLFESISTWALRDEPDNYNRAITFFRLTNEVSNALKSLFLLFASELVDSAGPMLDQCNPNKHDDDSCFGDDKVKNLYLTEFILRTLHNIFLHDHQNFINTNRFDVIMQPIVDNIENEFVLADENIQKLIQTSVAQLAIAASDDILWKQLNYQVLMKTRSDNPDQRIFGVKVCVEMAKKLGEDFEPLVPETIPFLSELLEDEDYKVVEACQNGVRELETTVGESLQKYF